MLTRNPLPPELERDRRAREIAEEERRIRADEEARRKRYKAEDEARERERAAQRAERERAEHERHAAARAERRAQIERDLYRAGLDAAAVRKAADAAMAALDAALAETVATEGDRLLAGAAMDIRRGRRPGDAPARPFGDLA